MATAAVPAQRDAAPATKLPTRVLKPWGYEDIWALAPGKYCGKRIEVNAGQALSLQVHERKHETMFCVAGRGAIVVADEAGELQTLPLRPGDVIEIPAGVVHRLMAAEDSHVVVMEASTTELDDVTRLEDRYGR